MSIIIKGVEMPKEGEALLICSDGSVWAKAWPTRGYMRMREAKASTIPTPHGRLIDGDALIERIEFEDKHFVVHDDFDKGRVAEGNNLCRAIRKYVPIIVEAEQEV